LALKGGRITVLSSLNLCTRKWWVVNVKAQPLYPQEKHWYSEQRRLDGLLGQSGQVLRGNNLLPPPGLKTYQTYSNSV